MRHCLATISAALVATCLHAASPIGSPASAKDLSGRFGVGIEQSLAGGTGLTMRYFLSEDVGMIVTLGADFTFSDDDEADPNSYLASFGFVWDFARSLHAHLGFGARGTLGLLSDESTPHFAIELPLVLTFFLSDHFSASVSTGLLINFVPESGAVLSPDGSGGTTVPGALGFGFGAGSVSSTLAVLYYF